MPKVKRLIGCVGLAAVLAGAILALRTARAQDGLPDLTGIWTGSSKGKFSSLDPLVKGGASKSTFTTDFSQAGPDLAGTSTIDADPPVDLAGVVGNGTFWAVSGDPAAPLLIVGHADKSAAHLKGGVLIGKAGGPVDAKFTTAK